MKIRRVRILCRGSESGPICAVQDTFGPAYRYSQRVLNPRMRIKTMHKMTPQEEPDMAIVSVVVRRVPSALVRALLKGSPHEQRLLMPGPWYEVHGE